MSFKLPDFIGKGLAAVGVLEEIPSSPAVAPPVGTPPKDKKPSSNPPPLPGTIASHPIPASTSSTPAIKDSEAAQQAHAFLETILGSTPEAFRKYLASVDESTEVLKDSLSGDQLTEKALQLALRNSKLKSADVDAAFAAAQKTLDSIVHDFNGELNEDRRQSVEQPTANIQRTQEEIGNISAQIAQLEEKRKSLEQSIAPARQGIAAAEQRLAEGKALFERACSIVSSTLDAMKIQITNHLPTKGVK